MPIATGLALGLGAASIAGGIGSAAIGAHAAGSAANAQVNAANHAADVQAKAAQDALDFQKQQYSQSQANMQPWLNSGQAGLANLDSLLGILPQGQGGASSGGNFSAAPAMRATGGLGEPGAGGAPGGVPSNATNGSLWKDNFANGGLYQFQNGKLNHLSPDQANTLKSQGYFGSHPVGTLQNTPSGPNNGASLQSLVNPNLGGYGSLLKGFEAPTNVTEQNDPGYQFRLDEGKKAIQRSAAASGGLLTGGTAMALNDYAQGQASNEYGNVYNRAYNTFESNQNNLFNRLAAISGIGQTAGAQLGQVGQQAAGNVANIYGNMGQQVGQNLNNAGAARASGYVGGANAWGGALSGGTNSLMQLMLLRQLGGGAPASTNIGGASPYLGIGSNL